MPLWKIYQNLENIMQLLNLFLAWMGQIETDVSYCTEQNCGFLKFVFCWKIAFRHVFLLSTLFLKTHIRDSDVKNKNRMQTIKSKTIQNKKLLKHSGDLDLTILLWCQKQLLN